MKTRVAEALARYGMLDGCRNVTVGLSGGADSCALLGVLCELREETEMNVSACHINHSLRGAESDRDEAFAVSLCERFGVPVEVYRVDVRGSVVKHESIEEAARRAEGAVQRPAQQRADGPAARAVAIGFGHEVGEGADGHALQHDALGEENVDRREQADDQQGVGDHLEG